MNTAKLVERLCAADTKIVVAESCTAGLICDILARTPGASKMLWGGFVCYTLEAKQTMLGVKRQTLEENGAVSCETALQMLGGALEKSGADAALAVTGLAGPAGDSFGEPVGTVWIAAGLRGKPPLTRRYLFKGSRQKIRQSAANAALSLLDSIC
ncbi:MAG: CinA family protein [Termitinemataceae bacterium]|nr:MAG: CinA family protein [Termitinemataceae bacterium]